MAAIFLSYPHEDAETAQKLYFALSNLGHKVFYDKHSLSVGEEYNFKIIDSIRESDFAIILLSPSFFSSHSYCITELKIIQTNWPTPNGKVFPIIAKEVAYDLIPNYLKSINILTPQGDLIAEAVNEIQNKVLGFSPSDSISHKIKKIEVENQLEQLDQEWESTKQHYLVRMGNKQVLPSNNLAITTSLGFLAFGLFVYFLFKNEEDLFGSWMSNFDNMLSLIGFSLGIYSFFYIKNKATKLKAAEKMYLERRNNLSSQIPAKNVDYLKMYRLKH